MRTFRRYAMTTRTRKEYRRKCTASASTTIEKGLTYAETLDLLYAVSEGVIEFIGAYPSREGRRLCSALRAVNRIVREASWGGG
jgi:hypothetical protein